MRGCNDRGGGGGGFSVWKQVSGIGVEMTVIWMDQHDRGQEGRNNRTIRARSKEVKRTYGRG